MFSYIVLLVIILETLDLSMMYENPCIMLLGFVEIAYLIVSLCYLLFRKFTIKGKVEVPIGISEPGKANLVKVIIKNKSVVPLMRAKALIVVEDTLSGIKKKSWMKLSEVLRGQNVFTKSVIFPGAGNYEVTLKKLRIYDITGLLHVCVQVRRMGRIQVMPTMHDVPVRLTLAVKNFYGEADVYDEHTPGHDNSELFQVREYQKGDRLQNVHWKMSAKQDEIMVKEHSFPKACPIILFLDYHVNKKAKKNTLAYIEAVTSISFSLIDAGCPHYVVWYDLDEMDIKRVRVDNEESLFYFIELLMKVKFETSKEAIIDRYKEKYRHEPYVWTLSIDENLVLKKGEEIYVKLSESDLEKSLSQMEIIL